MFEEIKNALIEELDVDEELITLDAEFVNDLKLNSLELADLVVLCEDKFDVEIEEQDIHSLITIGDLVDYLDAKQR
ncbi:MAG: acyl carrier protein [Clostridia bacterium]|nr:acyl carrier protein [Clostridia bacterium]MBQ7897778.1 acyl carrier protein [Clostridia bacterium]